MQRICVVLLSFYKNSRGSWGQCVRTHTLPNVSSCLKRSSCRSEDWLSDLTVIERHHRLANSLCLYSLLIPPSLSLSPSQVIMQRRFASSSFTLLLLQWFWDTPDSHIDWALYSVLAWSSFGLLQHLSSAFSPGMSCSVLQEEPTRQANESDAYHDFSKSWASSLQCLSPSSD